MNEACIIILLVFHYYYLLLLKYKNLIYMNQSNNINIKLSIFGSCLTQFWFLSGFC